MTRLPTISVLLCNLHLTVAFAWLALWQLGLAADPRPAFGWAVGLVVVQGLMLVAAHGVARATRPAPVVTRPEQGRLMEVRL
jgi:hypothetical protein